LRSKNKYRAALDENCLANGLADGLGSLCVAKPLTPVHGCDKKEQYRVVVVEVVLAITSHGTSSRRKWNVKKEHCWISPGLLLF
jgi:hypothetical protein